VIWWLLVEEWEGEGEERKAERRAGRLNSSEGWKGIAGGMAEGEFMMDQRRALCGMGAGVVHCAAGEVVKGREGFSADQGQKKRGEVERGDVTGGDGRRCHRRDG